MKLLATLALLVAVAVASARGDDEFYDLKYEDFDIEGLINSERLLKAYAHCFIGDGKCTTEGADFKKWLPEATQSACGKCTETQKKLVAKAINAIREQLPTEYDTIINQYDPDCKYQTDLKEFLAKYSA